MSTTDDAVRQLALIERWQTAHHEAGHAVAAVWRGATFHAVSLGHGGWTQVDALEGRNRDFVIFAGPWAEGRASWGPRSLDGVDDNGLTLLDHVTAAMRSSTSDLREYEPSRNLPEELWDALLYGSQEPEIPLARDASWYGELEASWPAMQSVAEMLLADKQVTPEFVQKCLQVRTKTT